MRWRSWLRHCAKSRKVVGSISDGVIGLFIDLIPPVDSACNTNENQESFLGCKGGRCVGTTTLSPSCAVYRNPPVQTSAGTALLVPFNVLPSHVNMQFSTCVLRYCRINTEYYKFRNPVRSISQSSSFPCAFR
jgi:hypothetical protein